MDQQLEKIFTLAHELPQFQGIEDENLRAVIQERYENGPAERVQNLIQNMEAQIAERKQKVRDSAEKLKTVQKLEAEQKKEDEKSAAQLLEELEKL